MAAGGYQAPSAPAPASGPGSLSRRTDNGPAQKIRDISGGAYGDRQDFRQLQQAAPLAQTPASPKAAPASASGASQPALTPLGAPTTRPDEPVTAGAPVGPGPGPESLNLPSPGATTYQTVSDTLQQLSQSAPTNPEVQYLLSLVQSRGI